MADIVYDDVVKLAEQLREDEQNRLILHLRVRQAAEHAKQLTTSGRESLYGKFANPNMPELSAEGLHAQLHAISSEWEQDNPALIQQLIERSRQVEPLDEATKSTLKTVLLSVAKQRELTNEERIALFHASIMSEPVTLQSDRREDWYDDDGR